MSNKDKLTDIQKARQTFINMQNIYEDLARRNEQREGVGWSEIDHKLTLLNGILNKASSALSQPSLEAFREKSKEFFTIKKNIEDLFLTD